MSTLFIQVGQAGNQLGSHLWPRAVRQAHRTQQRQLEQWGSLPPASASSSLPPASCLSWSPFFSSSSAHQPHARALLVDTEPKVLRSVSSLSLRELLPLQAADAAAAAAEAEAAVASAASLFPPGCLFLDQYGSGNNWSLGYRGRQLTDSRRDSGGSRGGRQQQRQQQQQQHRQSQPQSASSRRLHASVALPSSSSSWLMVSSALERVRVEAEQMDRFDSLLLLHSVGGGTGSGLGSLLLERLRDAYPSQSIVTASILPFLCGETPLQHFNTALTVQWLQQHCDAVLLFHNDTVLELLSALLQRAGGAAAGGGDWSAAAGVRRVGLPFAVINSWIADCLCDLLLPVTPPAAVAASASLHSLSSLPALLSTLCPMPRLKLLECWSTSGLLQPTAHEPLSWSSIAETMDRCTQLMLREDGRDEQRMLEFALIARGAADLRLEDWDRQRIDQRVGSHLRLCASARGDAALPGSASSSSSCRPRLGSERFTGRVGDRLVVDDVNASLSYQSSSLCLCCNHSRHSRYLRSTLSCARAMQAKKAYLHCYERYGCGDEELSAAFDAVQQIIDDYALWCSPQT